jgi:hypothetical protein
MATKKKIKTYGVRGLMEWVCNIPVGKSHMRIEFTGGILTSYGNTPAKYVTKDLLQQTIIEHSEFFKKKRIVLLSVVDTDEDEDRIPKTEKPAEQVPASPAPSTAPKTEQAAGSDGENGNADTNDADDADAGDKSDGDETPKDDADSDGERTSDGKLIVKVTSLDDAKTYLNEKCGIAVRELRSKAKILDAAEANGVSFEGI